MICQFCDLVNSEILAQKSWLLVFSITYGACGTHRAF